LADVLCGPNSDQIPQAVVAAVRDHFEEAEVAELILVCAQANFNNRVGNAAKKLLGP